MKRALVAAACAWPVLLAWAVWTRVTGHQGIVADLVYLAASRICHQLPDRSFQTAGVFWPVCGRCAGLYAAAPVGAVFAWLSRPHVGEAWLAWALGLTALPTIGTWIAEWIVHLPVATGMRAAAALPLGATIAFALVRLAPGRSRTIG